MICVEAKITKELNGFTHKSKVKEERIVEKDNNKKVKLKPE